MRVGVGNRLARAGYITTFSLNLSERYCFETFTNYFLHTYRNGVLQESSLTYLRCQQKVLRVVGLGGDLDEQLEHLALVDRVHALVDFIHASRKIKAASIVTNYTGSKEEIVRGSKILFLV